MLAPFAAFFLSSVVAAIAVEFKSLSLGGLLISVSIYLMFVAAPSFLAIVAGRFLWLRLALVGAMTAVAGVAGVLIVATDDAQAGLAVLFVPYVAIPLAMIVWIADAVVVRRWGPLGPAAKLAAAASVVAALAIDVVLVGLVLVVPLSTMSDAKHEVLAKPCSAWPLSTGHPAGVHHLAVLCCEAWSSCWRSPLPSRCSLPLWPWPS